MTFLTIERATEIVQSHGHKCEVSGRAGFIRCENRWNAGNGEVGISWDDVRLTRSAVLAWLGY
jgi:hypothetical protein